MISEAAFEMIGKYKGYVLGNETIDDDEGFFKNNFFVGKYAKDNVFEHLGKEFVIPMYEVVEYIRGFTYTNEGVADKFKEIVDGFSTSR